MGNFTKQALHIPLYKVFLKKIKDLVRFINAHPLGSRHKLKSYIALLKWQISQRINKGPRNIEFLEGLKMNVNIGETGVTGNIYVGVHDFKEIFFSLHLMRREDVFVDIGSNVGFYCISVSHIIGAKSFAFEPIKKTFNRLVYNIKLNQLEQTVTAINSAVGSSSGKIKMTADLDTVNHVTLENDSS